MGPKNLNAHLKLSVIITLLLQICFKKRYHFYRPQSSCGKIMYPQATVCSGGGGWTSPYLPPPGHGTWVPIPFPLLVTSGGHHWRPVHTCSLEGLPYQYWHLVVATEACAAGKPAVCILLECFLVRSRFIHRKRPFCRRTTARLPIDVWVTKGTSSNRSGGGTRVRRKGGGGPK